MVLYMVLDPDPVGYSTVSKLTRITLVGQPPTHSLRRGRVIQEVDGMFYLSDLVD